MYAWSQHDGSRKHAEVDVTMGRGQHSDLEHSRTHCWRRSSCRIALGNDGDRRAAPTGTGDTEFRPPMVVDSLTGAVGPAGEGAMYDTATSSVLAPPGQTFAWARNPETKVLYEEVLDGAHGHDDVQSACWEAGRRRMSNLTHGWEVLVIGVKPAYTLGLVRMALVRSRCTSRSYLTSC